MRNRLLLSALIAGAGLIPLAAQQPQPAQPPQGAQAQQQPQTRPLRVYLRAGLKTHGEGEHDYPQFLADWSKILQDRGAMVDGSLHFPTAQELANVDVMVTYKGDAGYMTADERTTLEAFLRRGGGLVAMHDTICADDPAWFSTIYGGAKKHGERNYTLEAPVAYKIQQPAHPIMQGMTDFTLTDESFFLMTWAKPTPGRGQAAPAPNAMAINVLATAAQAATPSAEGHHGEVVPQIWTYERELFSGIGGPRYRAFVWMQGHNYSNLSHAQVQPMLLRAIAWAGQAPIDSLMTVRAQRGGGGGRGGRQGGAAGQGAPAQGGARGQIAPAGRTGGGN